MSDGATNSGAAKFRAGDTCLHAWLAGRARGRWATARGRWIQAALTAGLLVTGLGAWALAVIQPWTMKTAGAHLVSLAAGINPDQVRSAAVAIEELVDEHTTPAVRRLRRNPFVPVVAAAETGRSGPPPVPAAADQVGADGPTPREILEKVKGLRLEVIVITSAGERWAVINGENYREGDAVAGLEIVEIQEGRAKLQQGGVTCLLRMD
ncbi:MAG TPA: general secretion pathway protein GspB [Phycisphaerae bacterium]|nr:general secretion pathway protein GspB [Phycisphaerae bacterium]